MTLALALLVGCALSGAPRTNGGARTDGGARTRTDGGDVQQARYEIDGEEVTAAQFKARLAELHGKEHWMCAETDDGGFVRYTARDAAGHAFEVVESSSSRPSSISRPLE